MKNYFLKLPPGIQDFILACCGIGIFFAVVYVTYMVNQ